VLNSKTKNALLEIEEEKQQRKAIFSSSQVFLSLLHVLMCTFFWVHMGYISPQPQIRGIVRKSRRSDIPDVKRPGTQSCPAMKKLFVLDKLLTLTLNFYIHKMMLHPSLRGYREAKIRFCVWKL